MLRNIGSYTLCLMVFALAGVLAAPVWAQQSEPGLQHPVDQASANSADVFSPDAILAALYQVISGPAGQKRNWDRFRSLFLLDARLIPTSAKPSGSDQAQTLTPEDYVRRAGPYLEKNGFFEKEVARKSERFGGIMQVFSTYESRHTATDAAAFARGINSIQLFFDGTRWWIVTVLWQEETPANPLPKEFQPHRE